MVVRLAAILISLSFSLSAFSQLNNEKKLDVTIGIDKIEKLNFRPSTKVQVGNEAVLNFTLIPSKKEITFKGIKVGKTSVTIRDQAGDIKARYLVNVTANDLSKTVQELREFLGDIEGIDVVIKGGQVVVEGKIAVPNDIGRVVIVLEKYPDVLRLVELSPQTQLIIAKNMQDEIQKNQIRDVTVRVVNSRFWLEGIVTTADDRARAEQIAAAYIPDKIQSLALQADAVQQAQGLSVIQNFIVINEKSQPPEIPKLLKITAQFVELTKDYNKIFGFKWNPTLKDGGGEVRFGKTNTGGVTTNSRGTLSGTIGSLFPKLASAKSAGFARVIQSGVLVMKEKETSTLRKTAKKQFAIGSGEFTKATNAEAGFKLTVTSPEILPEEKVTMKLDVEVSTLVGAPPEELKNNLNTSVVVKSKESAVLGGVVVNKTSTDFDKDPPFGTDTVEGADSSFLFSFIRSKAYLSNRSQFVVFVTPEIIDTAASGTEEIKKKFRRRRR